MVEIGYKYKFFGEDAEVSSHSIAYCDGHSLNDKCSSQIASKTLGVACYPDRNFTVAFIPVDRLNIHLKKFVQTSSVRINHTEDKPV